MSAEFRERIYLITGASSGIGRAVAIGLGLRGANVVALGRDEDELDKTSKRIEAEGGRCLCVPFDLLQFEHYGKLFLALKNHVPHLDGLVHCAGSLDACAPMQYVKTDDFRTMLDIHLTAPNMLTQIMLPLIRRAKACSVVFTTCDMIDQDQPNWHGYGLAKRALGYAAAMWQMEHPNKPYRFNTLNPGRVRTQLFKRAYPGILPGKIPPPESVVPAYLYLLADASAKLRGQTIHASQLDTKSLSDL